LGHIAAQAAFFLDYIGFDNACMDKIRDALFGLFLEQYFAHQFLFAGAKEFGLDKGVFFVESRKIHLQLLSRRRRIHDQCAFLFGACDKLFLSLGKRGGAAETKNDDNAMDNALHHGFLLAESNREGSVLSTVQAKLARRQMEIFSLPSK
jgi:hypothetical protein